MTYTTSRAVPAMGFSPNYTVTVASGSEVIGTYEYRPLDSEPYATQYVDPMNGQTFTVTAQTESEIIAKVSMGFYARVESMMVHV